MSQKYQILRASPAIRFPAHCKNSVNEILIKLWGSQWVAVLPPSSFTIVIVWCHNEVDFLVSTATKHPHNDKVLSSSSTLLPLHASLEFFIFASFPHLECVLHYFLNIFYLWLLSSTIECENHKRFPFILSL